ncbi:hypothetical protein LPJ63_001154 [Coemansia sp. RSA 2711]|nr:hypothetical protein LPJ63_001154 [Coemansia sp. RSA 2711]
MSVPVPSKSESPVALDRRPIDPPPVIQLILHDPVHPLSHQYTISPAFFMQVQLLDENGKSVIRQLRGHKASAMAGSMVSPLHPLRDMTSVQGAYFVFSDLSVRMEGSFRLRFDLFEITGEQVHSRASAMSDVFHVYSPKRFPGMMGLRIRIRTEAGTKKRGRKATRAAPSKRARLSEDDDAPLTTLQLHNASEPPRFQFPAAVSNTSSASTLAPGLPAIRGFNNSSLLGFASDPFSAYQENKENIPLGSQSADQFDRIFQPNSTLDLDDIAAVALLDSLSGGSHRALPATSSTAPSLLGPNSDSHGYCGISFSTAPPVAPPKPALRFSSLPRKQPDTLGLAPNINISMGLPFSNYRLSAVRSPEFANSSQDTTIGDSLLFGESSRFHPTLLYN